MNSRSRKKQTPAPRRLYKDMHPLLRIENLLFMLMKHIMSLANLSLDILARVPICTLTPWGLAVKTKYNRRIWRTGRWNTI
jgi:hypothetical protein